MLLASWRFCDEQGELYEPHEQGEQQKCISKCIRSGVMHSRQVEAPAPLLRPRVSRGGIPVPILNQSLKGSLDGNRPTPGVLFSGQLLRRCLAAMSASGVARVRRSVMQDESVLGSAHR